MFRGKLRNDSGYDYQRIETSEPHSDSEPNSDSDSDISLVLEELSSTSDDSTSYTYYNQPLHYLGLFTEKEIRDLEDQYNKSRYELNALVGEHKWVYRGLRGENWFAIGTDVSYALFQIVTSRDGIQSVAKLFNKDLKISNTAGLVIGAPLALVDMAFNLSAVSAAKEAIKATLEYALRDSYSKQFKAFLEQARQRPSQTVTTVVTWSFNKTILYSHNLLGTSANIIAFYEPISFHLPLAGDVTVPAWMPLLPTSAQLGIAAGFAYGGNRYYSLFSNPDYYQNFKEFWVQGFKDLWNDNPDGSPWLIGEFYRGNRATALQIAIQGLVSTVAIRAYPNYYYLAETVFGKLIGLPESATASLAAIASAIVAWHTLCARYPKTYNRYLADHIKVEALLREKIEDWAGASIDQQVQIQIDNLNPAMKPPQIRKRKMELRKQIMADILTLDKKLLRDQILEAEGRGYTIKNNPALGAQLAYRAFVGLYLGYSTIAPLLTRYLVDEPISMTILGMFIGSGLLAGALYKAEDLRITHQLMRQQLDIEMKHEAAIAPAQGSNASNRIADVITVGSNASRALSLLGSGERVFGNNSPGTTSAIAIIAAENMINTILFTYKKIRSSVSSWGCFNRAQETFFNPRPREAIEMQAPRSGLKAYLPRWMQRGGS